MLYISNSALRRVPPIDFVSPSPELYFLLETQATMQHSDYSPYPIANDNASLYNSPNLEEQSSPPYIDHPYHASQFAPPHQSNNTRYLGPDQTHNQESSWSSEMQQPLYGHSAGIPNQSLFEYSTHPYDTPFPPASPPYPMGGYPSYYDPASPVDPNSGMIFYPSTESPRLRTAQACQKCRARKAKVIPKSCRLRIDSNGQISFFVV